MNKHRQEYEPPKANIYKFDDSVLTASPDPKPDNAPEFATDVLNDLFETVTTFFE